MTIRQHSTAKPRGTHSTAPGASSSERSVVILNGGVKAVDRDYGPVAKLTEGGHTELPGSTMTAPMSYRRVGTVEALGTVDKASPGPQPRAAVSESLQPVTPD